MLTDRSRFIPPALQALAIGRGRLTRSAVWAGLLALAAGAVPGVAGAQGFSAYVSPPRIVAQVAPGKSLRQIVEIQHVGQQRGGYRLYTNDWDLGPDQAVTFTDALSPQSCRPWVAIERHELSLAAGARYRFRFEVTPPAEAPAGECRFALMVEGQDPARVQGALSFPVGARIAVIVYVTVGDAAPVLTVEGQQVATVQGQRVPVLQVRNAGNAHGRLEGVLVGTDAEGQRVELAAADVPILPGRSREIALTPVVEPGQPQPTLRYPLQVKGTLEWGRQSLAVDARFHP
ncbi:COG1470 family protein [Ideonella livida]|uniref:Molecular chaperone n=1 Tax=Ideonella livida TaxID=2707176 RepID=A0A7C9TLV6_9BURK|nr:hypothetical protein [Ideonella livida]NDY93458.1 hypothetical protein [Ideonella livida]